MLYLMFVGIGKLAYFLDIAAASIAMFHGVRASAGDGS
jgi:hypothetical protein